MFYLIGVAHRVQSFEDWDALNDGQLEFAQAVRDCIERFKPQVIAEEHSHEALGQYHSIAQLIATEHKLEHRFCDPESEWRKRTGYKGRDDIESLIAMHSWEQPDPDVRCARAGAIEIVKYFPMRESYWLECLSDVLGKDVLFICGQAHIESLAQLLKSKGVKVTVAAERIGVNAEDDRIVALARNYLAEHPDPMKDEPGVGNL